MPDHGARPEARRREPPPRRPVPPEVDRHDSRPTARTPAPRHRGRARRHHRRRHRPCPARAALAGHSLGGFLALHAFLTRPTLFSSYIAGSPSVWWNDGEIVARAEAFAADPPDLAGRTLFIGVGADEPPGMVAGAARVAAILAPLAGHGLALSHQAFAGEEHITVLPSLIGRSLRLSLRRPPG